MFRIDFKCFIKNMVRRACIYLSTKWQFFSRNRWRRWCVRHDPWLNVRPFYVLWVRSRDHDRRQREELNGKLSARANNEFHVSKQFVVHNIALLKNNKWPHNAKEAIRFVQTAQCKTKSKWSNARADNRNTKFKKNMSSQSNRIKQNSPAYTKGTQKQLKLINS